MDIVVRILIPFISLIIFLIIDLYTQAMREKAMRERWILRGVTAHNAAGQAIVGTMSGDELLVKEVLNSSSTEQKSSAENVIRERLLNCPNCAAPVSNRTRCEYCGTMFISKESKVGDWVRVGYLADDERRFYHYHDGI